MKRPIIDVAVALGFLGLAAGTTFVLCGSPRWGASAWLASLGYLYARGCERLPDRLVACVIASSVAIAYAVVWVNRLIAEARPVVLDARLYGFERLLGFDPSFSLGRVFQAHRWLAGTSAAFYLALPLGVALVYGLVRPRTLAWLPRAWAAGAVGAAIYWLVPAVGPGHAFSGYPAAGSEPTGTGPLALGGLAPRNCVPSLHLTWALVMLMNARGRLAQVIALAFLVFVGLATLGWGEHYAVDLVIAVPFAVGIQWFWARPGLALVCALLVTAWLAALLTNRLELLAHWWAVGATVGMPLALAYSPAAFGLGLGAETESSQ